MSGSQAFLIRHTYEIGFLDNLKITKVVYFNLFQNYLCNRIISGNVSVTEPSTSSIATIITSSTTASVETATISPNGISTVGHSPTVLVSPEMIRPFLKAQPRKSTNRGRRKGHTQILTDTPVKAQLESDQLQRSSRKAAKVSQSKQGAANKRLAGLFSPQTSGLDGPKKRKVVPQPKPTDTDDEPRKKRSESKQKGSQKKNVKRAGNVKEKGRDKTGETQEINEDDDTPCGVCGKRCNEPPIEDWKQCPSCKLWYHDRCCPDDTELCYRCIG